MEDSMSVGELYFLIFVCGSFGVLAVGLAAATIRYHHWREQLSPSQHAAVTRRAR
jgi:hypothetical protein